MPFADVFAPVHDASEVLGESEEEIVRCLGWPIVTAGV
jgi:hypothetical protein